MAQRIVTLRISRGSSSTSWSEFTISAADDWSVVDLLEHIRHAIDPSLLYRHSCHHGSCGTCACRIQGREALACRVTVAELGDGPITLEPLRGFPLIGDLVVDLSEMVEAMPLALTTVATDQSGMERFEDCIECGSCMSACPVPGLRSHTFVGPAPLAAMNRALQRQVGDKGEILYIALGAQGVPGCERHFACSRVCPTGVAPGRHIQELRLQHTESRT